MEATADIPRATSAQASAVLEEMARRRRMSIRLPSDKGWLSRVAVDPRKLLSRMAARELLYRVSRGRYVLAPRGSSSIEQAASPEFLVDVALAPEVPYYIGYLSALVSHRLTDFHSSDLHVAIPAGSLSSRVHVVPGRQIRYVTQSESRWPAHDSEAIEKVRAFDRAKEFWKRSSVERTLVDCLTRPELSGGMEVVVSAWARAKAEQRVDWRLIAALAHQLGPSAKRRTAFLMTLLDIPDVKTMSGGIYARASTVLFDSSRGFGITDAPRDANTGVLVNVPEASLKGWIAAAEMG
jgi:predicted transcriptional regulator of viral defense system